MDSVKLSIIIPTKDRYKYLLPLIKLLDSFHLHDTELVIEDNSTSNEEYSCFVNSNSFVTPITYNHNPNPISICQNIDNAIKHSHGNYVCVIGDDDAVTPLIREYVDWMSSNDVDSVRQRTELTYKWPAYHADNEKASGAYLIYSSLGANNYRINTSKAVVDVVKKGCLTLGKMPCVYQGIVKRTTLDRLYSIGGTYFPGPSPDMSNATSLSFISDSHYVTDIPIIISGGSEFQGGKNAKIKKWVQPLVNVPFISDEMKNRWDCRIPSFWCVYTVWPESAIKGLEYVRQQRYVDNMNFELLLAKCLYCGFEYRKDIFTRTDKKVKVAMLYGAFFIREHLAKVKRWGMKLFKISPLGATRVGNLLDIEAAIKVLMTKYYQTI